MLTSGINILIITSNTYFVEAKIKGLSPYIYTFIFGFLKWVLKGILIKDKFQMADTDFAVGSLQEAGTSHLPTKSH